MRFDRPAEDAAARRAGRQAQSRHQRGAARDPARVGRRDQLAGEALGKGRPHAVRALPDAGKPGSRGDRLLLFRVATAELQPPAAQQAFDYLLDPVLGLVVHSGTRTLAAARRARSCMTLIAPTVEFISAATSFNEYPCRKRSSSTRR